MRKRIYYKVMFGKNLKYPLIFFIAALLISGCKIVKNDNEWSQAAEFGKEWKFSIGDDPEWAERDFDDSDWDIINVPSPWENEGYHGYDGYAWYRYNFEVSGDYKNRTLYLSLGVIDDVDQVFLNGQLIGFTGSFPPYYETAYSVFRRYPVPHGLLLFNRQNTVAVRVYDAQLGGGIMSGELGIFVREDVIEPEIPLMGEWDFRTGDNMDWKETANNDTGWNKIIVPGFWESQGYHDYDGFAWYRKEVNVPDNLASKKLILLMGLIDDFDEVYVNGTLAGATGNMNNINNDDLGMTYQQQRNYFLPEDLIQPGKNVITVRVYDGFRDGGIYKGPVGIISQEKFTRFWKDRKE